MRRPGREGETSAAPGKASWKAEIERIPALKRAPTAHKIIAPADNPILTPLNWCNGKFFPKESSLWPSRESETNLVNGKGKLAQQCDSGKEGNSG
jgi:hypothetical protein